MSGTTDRTVRPPWSKGPPQSPRSQLVVVASASAGRM